MSPIPQLPVDTAPPTSDHSGGRSRGAREEAAAGAFASVLAESLSEDSVTAGEQTVTTETDGGDQEPVASEESIVENAPNWVVPPTIEQSSLPPVDLQAEVEIGVVPIAAGTDSKGEAVEAELRLEKVVDAVPAVQRKPVLVENGAPAPEMAASSEEHSQADLPAPQRAPVSVATETDDPVDETRVVAKPSASQSPAPDQGSTSHRDKPAPTLAATVPTESTRPEATQPPKPYAGPADREAIVVGRRSSARPVSAEVKTPTPNTAVLEGGVPEVETDDEPTIRLQTRLGKSPESGNEELLKLQLGQRHAPKGLEPPMESRIAPSKPITSVTEPSGSSATEVRPTVVRRESMLASLPSGDSGAAQRMGKPEPLGREVADTSPVVQSQKDDSLADERQDSQADERQPARQSGPTPVAPRQAPEPTTALPEEAPKKSRVVSTATLVPAPVGAVLATVTSDVGGRQTTLVRQPVSEPSTVPAPPVENPLVSAKLNQQAARTTLNVVIHDDRLGRVALQLVERGGWIDTAIRASDPRGAQLLTSATSGLVEALQQRGISALTPGGATAWDSQEGQHRDNPHREQEPQRRRLRVRRQGQEFIGALAQAAR